MTDTTPELTRLGDALEEAARADLAPGPATRRRRRLALVAVAAALALPAVAFAADRLLTGEEQVAASMPAGTLALAGTEPVCTVVEENVEYHCVLTHPPAPEVSDWLGTVEPTVDATSHVNGGCRSLTSDGLEWRCYLGEAAVEQEIIGGGFLGELSSGPGVG
jgi:hypothetical protein